MRLGEVAPEASPNPGLPVTPRSVWPDGRA